mmetsp:Transcript_28316/g.72795  ORF Transcript_28316/g.72795 Transcript_28316/m.72795 type:complete len:283 (+) Transcript_28316:42-890(+)|eukprot:jgi/Tetstr1/435818/TSEL_024706.t1
MAAGLSPEQVAAYVSDGFVAPLRLLEPAEAAAAAEGLARYEAVLGGAITGVWRFKAHLTLPWFADLVRHPKLVAAVRSALRSEDILCWSTDVFAKEPRPRADDGSHDPPTGFTGWHQDSTYVAFDQPDVLTLWLALTPSMPRNGCVRFWPGSHQRGQLPHVERPDSGSLLLLGQEVAVDVPDIEGVDASLQPGEASLHHNKLVHCSGPNLSDSRRVGLAIRYMAASVRQRLPTRDSVTLVCGKPPGDYYRLEPHPAAEMDEAGLAAHRAAVGAVFPEGVPDP